MRRVLRVALLIALIVLGVALWGAARSFRIAAGVHAFTALADHDYLADIETLCQQGKLTEALTLSRFVCEQATYPQQPQACQRAAQLEIETRRFWYRASSFAKGAWTGTATNGWALAGATTADFFVVGDVRDLVIQSWFWSRGQETDELLMALSAVGVLTVTLPSVDWLPALSKAAVRLKAFSKPFVRYLLDMSRQTIRTGTRTPLRRVFRELRHVSDRLGPANTLGILPVVERAEDMTTLAHLVHQHPQRTYGLLKTGGRQAFDVLAHTSPDSTADLVRAARKGVAGVQLFQGFGRRLFTSHLLAGAAKALHRGRLPQAVSWWLAAQTPLVRFGITGMLAVAWLLTLTALWSTWWGQRRHAAAS